MYAQSVERSFLTELDAILAEASPKDSIWGIGLDASAASEMDPSEWPGQNLLGKILMELRRDFSGKKNSAAERHYSW